jgi:hypothetical protein
MANNGAMVTTVPLPDIPGEFVNLLKYLSG